MKKIQLYTIIGSVMLLGSVTSCQVVNKYRRPDVNLNALYRDATAGDTTSIATIPWEHYFADTVLQNLIHEGLDNNFDLQIAYTRIKQAEANLLVARSAYFPTVALAGQVTHTRLSDGAQGKDVLGYHTNDFRLGITAQWEADIWGKLNRQHRAQYAAMLNSYAYRDLIQTSLIANIANSYYALQALDEQLRITRQTVGLLQESTATIEALLQAGMQNSAAVEQSKALLYATQAGIPDLESSIRQTENSLCVLVGRQPGAVERTALHVTDVPQELRTGIPAQLLSCRPDVKQAELSFRSAFELKNAAIAAFYPSITLNAGSILGYDSGSFSHFFQPQNLLANIIGGLTMPLFQGNKLRAQLKIAKAQQQEALLNFRKTMLTAGQEVSDILYTFHSSLRKNEVRTKQIQSLRAAVYDTQELLKAGEANYTEVLSAEQNLLQAQLSQVSDKLQQMQASVNLYRALGGGME
ncbi:MAG: efflux transporter outer membrane subunit [Prevotellaceae bacterium]|jgi:NodT family efflux transporter outer membrane factor (OMF) lipoprotein|nr:efflux transporter outer membrane subunit [Prevotellaceae bacterium]